jgi:hypothetical protein
MIPALLCLVCFPLLGATVGFTLFYLVESAMPHHPHAMVGLPAVLGGAPLGALAGLIASLFAVRRGLFAVRRGVTARTPLYALAAAALLALLFVGWFVGSGRRW